jgi:hypothetical protein
VRGIVTGSMRMPAPSSGGVYGDGSSASQPSNDGSRMTEKEGRSRGAPSRRSR